MGEVVQMEQFRASFGRKLFLYYVNLRGEGVIIEKESGDTVDVIAAEQLMLMKAKNEIRGSYDIEGIRQYEIRCGELLSKDTLRLTGGKAK